MIGMLLLLFLEQEQAFADLLLSSLEARFHCSDFCLGDAISSGRAFL
jgi:hypothetical protein